MVKEIAVASPATPLPAVEVARLEALRRLSMGAAHALNNAFTTVVGEASFLREERKGDPVVVEACDAILRELDRCAKLTRALLARRNPPQAGRGEVDLVRLVRDLTPLLRETLGRQKELAVVMPDDLVLVKGEAEALELLALLLVQHGAEVAPGTARLRLGVHPEGALARLELEIEADGLGRGDRDRVPGRRPPARSADAEPALRADRAGEAAGRPLRSAPLGPVSPRGIGRASHPRGLIPDSTGRDLWRESRAALDFPSRNISAARHRGPVEQASASILKDLSESTAVEAESWNAAEILTWAIKKFHPRLALSCSFGNPEGMALLDMMHRIEPTSRVYVLDTGRLPQATYDLIDRVRDRYDKPVEVVFPDADALQKMVREHGMNSSTSRSRSAASAAACGRWSRTAASSQASTRT